MYCLVLLAWNSANLSRRVPSGVMVAVFEVHLDAEAHWGVISDTLSLYKFGS